MQYAVFILIFNVAERDPACRLHSGKLSGFFFKKYRDIRFLFILVKHAPPAVITVQSRLPLQQHPSRQRRQDKPRIAPALILIPQEEQGEKRIVG